MAKRQDFTPDFKAQVVLEDLTGVKSPAGICREHRVRSETLSRWKAELLERGRVVFWSLTDAKQEQAPETDHRAGAHGRAIDRGV